MDYNNAYEVLKWFAYSISAGIFFGFLVFMLELLFEKEKNKTTL